MKQYAIKKFAIIAHLFTSISEIKYRIPMHVTDFKIYYSFTRDYAYPICPRCKTTMEREYMAFCSRCGQKLDWSRYVNDETIF